LEESNVNSLKKKGIRGKISYVSKWEKRENCMSIFKAMQMEKHGTLTMEI
jgi:hypothetical protein